MAIGYTTSETSSRYLVPTGDAEIDVVNNMAWTLTPPSGRSYVPYAILREYQMTQGQLIAAILYYARLYQTGNLQFTAASDPAEVYKYKYYAEATGFSYKLPYFNTKKFSRSTTFGYEDGSSPFQGMHSMGQSIAQFGNYKSMLHSGIRDRIGFWAGMLPTMIQAGLGLVNTVIPGKIDFEHPQSWSGTSEGTFNINFDLFNTGTVEDITNNRNLAYILAYQNSPSRRTFAIVDPTVIYSLYIPDVVSLPACYISNVEITNLGNTRTYPIGGQPRIVPEAYRFALTVTSLLMPTRNIIAGLDSGELVQTIANEAEYNAIAQTFQSQGLQTGSTSNINTNQSTNNTFGNNFTNFATQQGGTNTALPSNNFQTQTGGQIGTLSNINTNQSTNNTFGNNFTNFATQQGGTAVPANDFGTNFDPTSPLGIPRTTRF